ncbi:MAG TPA: hypothetical protein PK625_04900 [Spirochaetales bacterium]|nr:hypothetical protein [Spirochaetales bacterium]MBP7262689.1 hypothetical protein [Spirochaetia bacterium]HPE36467.1 hypothetical protein [Spirochaetales bacterium]
MRRVLTPIALLTLSLALIALAAQSGRYRALEAELERLEDVQSEWVEENRKLLSNVAVAGARSRVDESMADAEGYRMVSPKTTLRILVQPGGERADGGDASGL